MMTHSDLQAYCLTFKGAVEDFPFGEDVAVFKVRGKMFALLRLRELPPHINLKCDPPEGELLRANYPAITEGYHMDKRHWITVRVDDSLTMEFVQGLILQSYQLIVQGLTRAERAALAAAQNAE
jgi:predicted DNA-binding protein (MmcQ/YjbR family)